MLNREVREDEELKNQKLNNGKELKLKSFSLKKNSQKK
jgi:hypothetical protein